MRYYTLKFSPTTVTEIKGSKQDLIRELENLIGRIEELDEEAYASHDSVPLYDMNGEDFITAILREE